MKHSDVYAEQLANRGIQTDTDDDTVAFDMNGQRYFLVTDPTDSQYLQFTIPNFCWIGSAREFELAVAASTQTTAGLKGVKVFPVGSGMWATVEMFLPEAGGFARVFERCVSALHAGIRNFAILMQLSISLDPGNVAPEDCDDERDQRWSIDRGCLPN